MDVLFQVSQAVNLDIIKAEKAFERTTEALLNSMTDNRCEELFKILPGDLTGYPDEGRSQEEEKLEDPLPWTISKWIRGGNGNGNQLGKRSFRV